MAAIDLCTVSDVRDFLQKPSIDVSQDPVIQVLITAASKTIMNFTEREFLPQSTGATRTFEFELTNWPSYLSFAPYDLRNVTQIQIDTDQTAATITTAEYRMMPVNKPDGVWTGIRLMPLTWPSGRIVFPNRQLQVAGDWGFPSVPEDVKQAAIMTTAVWLRREVSAFSTTFNLSEDHVERPEALPSAVRALLGSYTRVGA